MDGKEEKITNPLDWNTQACTFPKSHILQSWQWGEFKQQFGWKMLPKSWRDVQGEIFSLAMLLRRTLFIGGIDTRLAILYAPRGPLINGYHSEKWGYILDTLETYARRETAISVKIDPEVILGTGVPGSPEATENVPGVETQMFLKQRGWFYSDAQVQFRNTIWLDLTTNEDDLLARMKQKTRYNIRLACRKGVTVKEGSETHLPSLYRMYLETSVRDGFVVRSEQYYLTLWKKFLNDGMARVLLAEFDDEILAGLILFHFGSTAWYFYGMSNQLHREKMASHLLQWEAMKLARQLNCTIYDLWGAPEIFDSTDGMWGVYRFKEGFGGTVVRTLGAWDYAPRKAIYSLFMRTLPQILNLMRMRRKAQTRQELT